MSNGDIFSKLVLVRPVDVDYKPHGNQRVFYFRDDQLLSKPPGWLQSRSVQAWLIDEQPRQKDEDMGLLADQLLRFPPGDEAVVDLHYSHIRVATNGELLLIRLAAANTNIHEMLVRTVNEAMVTAFHEVNLPASISWARLEKRLQDQICGRIRNTLGLELTLRIEPKGRGGRRDITLDTELRLAGLDAPQSFSVNLLTDDDNTRLPLRATSDGALNEEDLIRQAIEETATKLQLEDFSRAPGSTVSAFEASVSEVLQPLARRVRRLKLVPGDEFIPDVQRPLQTSFNASNTWGVFDFKLRVLLQRTDANMARNFEHRAGSKLNDALTSKAQEITNRQLVGQTLDIIHEDNVELIAKTRDEIDSWLEQHTGYRSLDTELVLTTKAPKVEPYVRLRDTVEITPIKGLPVKLDISASAKLERRQEWLRAGAHTPTERWKSPLRETLLALTHTLDQAEAVRSQAMLETWLRQQFEQLIGADGYTDGKLRLDVKISVKSTQRRFRFSIEREFPFGPGEGGRMPLRISSTLELVDEWAFVATSQEREEESWAQELLAQVIIDELAYKTRLELRTEPDPIKNAIEDRYLEEVAKHGYKLRYFVLDGLRLPSTARTGSEQIIVSTSLHGAEDRAIWTGFVRARVEEDVTKWVGAGEPELTLHLSEWAEEALNEACRSSVPGDVDDARASVEASFEDALTRILADNGYRLDGLDGQLSATNSPPEKDVLDEEPFECKVGQRTVRVVATVHVHRISSAAWRRSRVRDLEGWLRKNTLETIREILLPMSYTDVLRDVVLVHKDKHARVTERITDALNERATAIGYQVQQVLTFPDKEARDLLRRFTLDFQMSDVATDWSGRTVNLRVHFEGNFDDFEGREVSELLSRDSSVKTWLEQRISQRISFMVRKRQPFELFFDWNKVHDELSSALTQMLRDDTVRAPEVQITLEPTDYIDALRSLFGSGPHAFRIELPPTTTHARHGFTASFSVDGFDKRGADKVFTRTVALTTKDIEVELSSVLVAEMASLSNQEIFNDVVLQRGGDSEGRTDETLLAFLSRRAAEFCANTYGLAVVLVRIDRDSTAFEQEKWALVEEFAVVRRHDRENRELVLQKIRAALESGDYDAFDDLKKLHHKMMLNKSPDVPPGPGEQHDWLVDRRLSEAPTPIDITLERCAAAEPGCQLSLSVHLTVTRQGHSPVPVGRITEDVAQALLAVLEHTQPALFWGSFTRGAPSIKQRCVDAINSVFKSNHTLFHVEISIAEPVHPRFPDLDELLQGGDLDIQDLELGLDGGVALYCGSAKFTINGVVVGRWRRFEQSRVNRNKAREWAARWLKEQAKSIASTALQGGNMAQLFAKAFEPAFELEFGLQVTLGDVQITASLVSNLDALREEVEDIDSKLMQIAGKEGEIYTRKRSELGARRALLIEEIKRKNGIL